MNETISGPNDYVRFIILSGPRTGSHMLAQALNSSPSITCFREVFNTQLPLIQFGVEGYDGSDPQDIALRQEEPVRFLRQRIFCQYPRQVRAVGFKFHYGHPWGSPGILDQLLGDSDLRVLHLTRQNALRALVSLKLAQRTGVWLQEGPASVPSPIRHPVRAAGRAWRRLRGIKLDREGRQIRLRISPEELSTFVIQIGMQSAHFDQLFREHTSTAVTYEEMVDRPGDVFRRVQSFLGQEPVPLTILTRRQNPEPLRRLIENYDELREAFTSAPESAFFD